MKAHLFSFLLFLAFTDVFAQSSFENAIYTNVQHSSAAEIIETSTHEYLITATLQPFMHIYESHLFKIDSTGNVMWDKYVNNGGSSYRILEMNDGSYLLTKLGSSYSQIMGSDLANATFNKLDTSGNFIWGRVIGDSIYSYSFYDIINNFNHGFTTIGSLDSANVSWALVTQYDFYGNINFQKRYLTGSPTQYLNFSRSNCFKNVFENTDSSIYLLSAIQGMPALMHIDNHGDSLATFYITDSLSAGQVIISRNFSCAGNLLKTLCTVIDTNAGIQIRTFISTYDLSNGSSWIKTIANGNWLLSADDETNIIFNNCTNNFNTQNPLIEKRDSNDNVLWAKCIESDYVILPGYQRLNICPDRGILYAGLIDSINSGQQESIYYVKIDSSGNVQTTDIKDFPFKNELIVYPNPSNDFINLKSEHEIQQLNIFDTGGRNVLSKSQKVDKISVCDLSNGVYFMEAITATGVIRSRFLKTGN